MKVAGLLTENEPYSPRAGAISRWTREVYPLLSIPVTIYAPESEYSYKDKNLVEIKKGRSYKFVQLVDNIFPPLNIKSQIYLRKVVSNMSEKIVHIHNRPEYVPTFHKNNNEQKIILHLHNRHLAKMNKKDAKEVIKKSNAIVGCSDYIISEIIKRHPTHREKIHRVYNGVNVKKFYPRKFKNRNDGSKIIFVGRICKEKGVHTLIKAMKQIVELYPKTTLTIVGATWFDGKLEGEYYSYLREISKDIKENIEFTGYLPDNKLRKEYRRSDICVVPSIWKEPFGLVVAEAMASGLPTIVTDRGAPPEIVGDSGRIVDPENINKMELEIVDLIKNPLTRERLGRKARKRAVDQFTWNHTAEQFEAVLNSTK